MKESREHEKKLFEMLLQSNQQNQAQQFHPSVSGMSPWQNSYLNQLNTSPHASDATACQSAPAPFMSTPNSSKVNGKNGQKTYHTL